MFGLLKKKNPYEQNAREVYARVLGHVRNPVFYGRYGVPDSFDGRFDLLVLHVYLVMDAADDEAFSQALFDSMFADMDQTLREMGIGDMGIPKHMRKMMKAFNGRVHVYKEALGTDKAALSEALRRNLYGDGHVPEDAQLFALVDYVWGALTRLCDRGFEGLLHDEVLFEMEGL